MGFARVSFLQTFGREEKICNFCRCSLRNSLLFLRSVPMSKRIDMRCYADDYPEGKLIFAVSVFFMFAVFCSYSPLLKISSGSTDSDRKHTSNRTDF